MPTPRAPSAGPRAAALAAVARAGPAFFTAATLMATVARAQSATRDTAATRGAAPVAVGVDAPVARTPAADSPHAVAVRADRPPVLDGREDDAIWQRASAMREFREFSPTEGKAPRFRTEFKAAYDDANLYVFVRAFDPHPDSIMTALTRRDVRGPSDQLKVMVDAYHDRRSGFEFAVNPAGVKRDYAMYNDRDEDGTWDGVWDVATRVDSVGWTAEFRIPFSQLRYANRHDPVFGFAVWRDIERYKERTSWPRYRPSQPGIASQLGLLTGICDIAPFRRREFVPFAVAKNQPVAHPGDTPGWGRAQKLSFGAAMKYGLTPNLTLDATANPDFGQVEADPAVVNLSAFETFFPEQRPFFIEGAGIYSFSVNSSPVNRSSETLFYSRRIGRAPQLFSRYADDGSPSVTPILGASKLTGRLAGGLNVGALEAVTGRVNGTDDRTTEPTTSYTVLRAQQELRGGATTVGAMATGAVRALDHWSNDYLRHEALVAGADVRHRWGHAGYELNAKVSASRVGGSRASILQTQLSPVHLYQRPDDALALDSTRTSLTGDAEEVNVAKFGGSMVHWLTGYERQSAGYDVNDLGYLRRANQQTWKNWLGLVWQTPTPLYRSAQANVNFQEYWTAGGLRLDRMLNSNGNLTLQNNQGLYYGLTAFRLPGSFCDVCARGGPAVRRSPVWTWNLGWTGDDRRRVVPALFVADAYGERSEGRWRSRNLDVNPSAEFRLLPQLQLALGADWNRNWDDVQWIGNFVGSAVVAGSPTTALVTHYAFARLEQETRAVTVRTSYAATPSLSLQLYVQPFVSRGAYSDVRELSATPRAARYTDRYVAYVPPPGTPSGFDVLQLRSTSVVRWEFRPGSALFAVWQHGRDGFDASLRDRPWRSEYVDLFALRPVNTFLLKFSYWIN